MKDDKSEPATSHNLPKLPTSADDLNDKADNADRELSTKQCAAIEMLAAGKNTSQVARLHEGVEAVSGLLQREVPSVAIDMLVDAATDLLAAFRELESGLLDAQGDVDTLEAALEEEEDGQQV